MVKIIKILVVLIIQFLFFSNINLDKAFSLAVPTQINQLANIDSKSLSGKKISKLSKKKISKQKLNKQKINKKIPQKKDSNLKRFLRFLLGAFSIKEIKKLSELDKEWKKFSNWLIKISIINLIVSIFFGITSFGITFFIIFFISSGNFSIPVLIIWMVIITANIIAKILFEKNKDILYERSYFSFNELLKKEAKIYKVLKISKKKFNSFDSGMISSAVSFWLFSQSRIIDFCFGVLGGFIAIGVLNPIYLIPYSIILVIAVSFIMFLAFLQKNDYGKLYEAKNKTAKKNELYSAIGKEENICSWNNGIQKKYDQYDSKRIVIDIMLRSLIFAIIPLIGVIIFCVTGTSSVILLFYILSLNLFSIFSLVYCFREGNKGIESKNKMFSLIDEIRENRLIINNYTWNKKRINNKELISPYKVDEIFLENFSLEIKNGENKNIDLNNKKIGVKRGRINIITGKSGSGKTSLMQFLGAKLFLNEQDVNDEYTFGAKGSLYAKGNFFKKQKKVKINPENIGYENLQKLVSYYSFDDIEQFNIDIDMLPKKQKIKFIKYIKKMMPDNFDESQFKLNGNLSSGERSRVKLALILAYNSSRFILLDQPLVNLDSELSEQVFNVLDEFSIEEDIGILIGQPEINFDCKDRVSEIIDLTGKSA